ncbi:hypothetical protein [Citromicrobium bathyomarinum]|uniref:hypothetical protein n=1 Tax=Citromicrobium bathyomarinum TaxID=72174 RepID=UPI00315AEF7C
MATAYLRAESVPVILPHNLSAAAAVLAHADPDAIGKAVEALVLLLDAMSGDPDLEATDAEDDFVKREPQPWHGPGCTISDPDEGVDDGRELEDEREPDETDAPIPIPGGGSGDC